MKCQIKIIIALCISVLAMSGCGNRSKKVTVDEVPRFDTAYVVIGGQKWAKFNVGASSLPSEDWTNSVGGFYSSDVARDVAKPYLDSGWRIPSIEDWRKLLPEETFISKWDGGVYISSSGIKYEWIQNGKKGYLRLTDNDNVLELPAAGWAEVKKSVGFNGVYLSSDESNPAGVYYFDSTILMIHKFTSSRHVSLRLIKD